MVTQEKDGFNRSQLKIITVLDVDHVFEYTGLGWGESNITVYNDRTEDGKALPTVGHLTRVYGFLE